MLFGNHNINSDGANSLTLIDCQAIGAADVNIYAKNTKYYNDILGDYAAASNDNVVVQRNAGTVRGCAIIEHCWNHDSRDNGNATHELSDTKIIGGLYEHNASNAIIAITSGTQDVDGVITRSNTLAGITFYDVAAGSVRNCIHIGDAAGIETYSTVATIDVWNCIGVNCTVFAFIVQSGANANWYNCRYTGNGFSSGGTQFNTTATLGDNSFVGNQTITGYIISTLGLFAVSGQSIGWVGSSAFHDVGGIPVVRLTANNGSDYGLLRTYYGTLAGLNALVANAATAGAGASAYISDGNVAGVFGATAVGGGSFKYRVTSDGTNWIVG